MSYEDRRDHLETLVGNIRRELGAQEAMRDLGLSDDVRDGLARDLATEIDYAFLVRWLPRWVKVGDAHRWTEPRATGDEGHYAECVDCGWITADNDSADAASEYFARHRAEVHGATPDSPGYCCEGMWHHAHFACEQHKDPIACPDQIMTVRNDGRFGIPIHDGGTSMVEVSFCPWCGIPLQERRPW